jgi:hypothetical protein
MPDKAVVKKCGIGILLGVLGAIVWSIENVLVTGLLAFSRFPDLWPIMWRESCPLMAILLFGVIPSLFLFTRFNRISSRTAIFVSVLVFLGLEGYSLQEVGATEPAVQQYEFMVVILLVASALAWYFSTTVRTRAPRGKKN